MNLATISPATKTVVLKGTAVIVAGLSMRKLVQLFAEFPEVVGLLAGGKIDIAQMIIRAPNIGFLVFSLALVGPARSRWRDPPPLDHDELCEEFDDAPAGRQVEALAAIFDMTFKGGERAGPFLKSVAGLLTPNSTADTVSAPVASEAPPEPGTPQENSPSPSSA